MSGNQKTHHKDQSQPKPNRAQINPHEKKIIKLDQMLEAPETLRQDEVLNAQQQYGNQVVQRALDKKGKREALTDEQGNLDREISDSIQQERGGGAPLPEDIQGEAKQQFKRDFKDVRLHTSEKADQLSRKIRARAFTIGKDIFFKKGVFSPGTSQGRETLIHELTHVVQQSGSKGSGGRLKLGARNSSHEQEADRVGKQNSTPTVSGGTAPSSAVQTYGEEEELQMQAEEDEEEVQMQEDEEELQMQEDEEELQMQEDEEELQMQEDEEEIQMQPDPQGVVQRDEDRDERLRIRRVLTRGRRAAKKEGKKVAVPRYSEIKRRQPVLQEFKSKYQPDTDVRKNLKPTGTTNRSQLLQDIRSPGKPGLKPVGTSNRSQLLQDIRSKDKPELKHVGTANRSQLLQDIRSSEKPKLKHVGTTNRSALQQDIRGFDRSKLRKVQTRDRTEELTNKAFKEDPEADPKKRRGAFEKATLTNILQDPSKSTKEATEAEEKLRNLHSRPLDPRMSTARKGRVNRLKKLKEQAQMGNKDAYEKYKEEQSKASGLDKFMASSGSERAATVVKGAARGLWGAAKGLFGSTAKDLKTHFFGAEKKKEEKKEEKPATPPVTVNVGGGGGGGMMELMDKYADLRQENKELKKQLEDMQKGTE